MHIDYRQIVSLVDSFINHKVAFSEASLFSVVKQHFCDILPHLFNNDAQNGSELLKGFVSEKIEKFKEVA